MAARDTPVAAAQSSSPPTQLDQSPSNLSSPLSDVEDKDGDADEMQPSSPTQHATGLGTPDQVEDDDDGSGAGSERDTDGESVLSDVDIVDSEAETERLYDTPPKKTSSSGLVNGNKGRQLGDRVFERSPSKLQQQIQADVDAENNASDSDELSDADDDVSMASSTAGRDTTKGSDSRSPSPVKTAGQIAPNHGKGAEDLLKDDLAEKRKRKRSLLAEQSETEQPSRKRTRSIGGPDHDFSADDEAIQDHDANSATAQSREHIADEDDVGDGENDDDSKDKPIESTEEPSTQPTRSKSSRRNGVKRRKSPDDEGGGDEKRTDSGQDDGETATAEEDDAEAHVAEDENADGDADEGAETAHRNEEELERKKAAWEELAAIEKQFSSFRERLYQERLDQLNQEEAMLIGDNPTHPEYLAMLQCIDGRRDESIRLSKIELEFKMNVVKDRAVAERAQILSQFYQSVRASKESVLEELGKEWYEIQHERRRYANNIPDFGIRFPATKVDTVKHAVAYNKEVSILSGFAKYKGFPAAPNILGASEEQLDQDFDAMIRARQSSLQQASAQPFQAEMAVQLPVPFERMLGPAGEEFLQQTPWANPNHPVHQLQRKQSASHHSDTSAPVPVPASGNRRPSHHLATAIFSPSAIASHQQASAVLNGETSVPVQMAKSHSAAGAREASKPPKMVSEAGAVQVS